MKNVRKLNLLAQPLFARRMCQIKVQPNKAHIGLRAVICQPLQCLISPYGVAAAVSTKLESTDEA